MAPINEYLLLELQPASKIPTTPMLDAANKKKIPTLKSRTSMPLLMGRQLKAMIEARITM